MLKSTKNIFLPDGPSLRRPLAELLTAIRSKKTFLMNSNVSKECEICNEEFNEGDHCPKVLPCSHCFCTLCIEKLIGSNNMKCPFCRKLFNVNSANDLGTNNSLLNALKYVNELELALKAAPASLKGKRTSTMLKMCKANNMEVYTENADRCNKAASYIKRSLQQNLSVKESLENVTKTIQKDIYPVLAEIERRAETHIRFLDEEIYKLHSQTKAVSSQKEIIGDVGDKMEGAPDFSHIDPILDETDDMISRTNEIMGDLKKFLIKNQKTRDAIEKRTKKISEKLATLKDIGTPIGEGQEDGELDLSSEMVAMATEDDVPKCLEIEYLKVMRKPVWNVLQRGRAFATKSYQGRKRYAQITIKGDNEFCLHHLRDVPPIHSFHIVDYDDLRKGMDKHPELTFLEMQTGNEYLGRIIIRLSPPDLTKARQFSLLCTGETGPSYANTNGLRMCNKGDERAEFAVFGDYEENDGSGGKGIIADVDWKDEDHKEEYVKPWVEGLVGGLTTEDTAAMFGIFFRNNPGAYMPGCFGKVEKGLEILTNVVDKGIDIRRCQIVDCGVVFSLKDDVE
ncbi:uncharacterized protein [Palaemon carinicauda]|uniref:uncharacterized protein isoform X2 n=1 Tax=Palaemon carinicauda TaxID=392227 RepID=UPI0035B6304B